MKRIYKVFLFLLSIAIVCVMEIDADTVQQISPNVSVVHGAVNGVLIESASGRLAIYGDPCDNPAQVDRVLFTHHRRDVVWAGLKPLQRGALAVVPQKEKQLFTNVESYWSGFTKKRFHDYAQQSTKILTESFEDAETVRGGETIAWGGLSIQVIDTPGYTRGAVSYLFEIDGRQIACVGDLIFGNGQILDLYSLQDAIPSVNLRGYHGYAARTSEAIQSLRTIAKQKPDLLIPSRGPVIDNPQESIQTLIRRLQTVYENYLSICALRWYFGDEHIQTCAERVLDKKGIDWMPMAETVEKTLPDWIVPISNARLIVSKDGSGFLVDCGSQAIAGKVNEMLKSGRLKSIDGIYITHYHDDHTDRAQAQADEWKCRLYFCPEQRDILERPAAYQMPCLTPNPIKSSQIMKEGSTKRWKEFQFTFSYHPGQTLYHGGLLVKKDGGESIFFIGDSFTPSGIDDYCLLNRNLLHPDTGFFYCLNVLKKMEPNYLLINQHVGPGFRFSRKQIDFMIDTLERRVEALRELFPWEDPNFGIDERWARFYPYAQEAKPGQRIELSVAIMNHADREATYQIRLHAPDGWSVPSGPLTINAKPRQEGFIKVPVTVSLQAKSGPALITADLVFNAWQLKHWTEALIEIK